jgi:hypothetical protein
MKAAGPHQGDWAANARSFLLAWGLPTLAIVAGSFGTPPVRAVVWALALTWMGSACLMNARRCGRTHCRYIGPFYLLLIVPVLLQGSGALTFGPYARWLLGGSILVGSKLIWWTTETALGKYSD